MTFQHLVAVLPCHSLDDFPFHLEGSAAEQVLACYTALWHPALIAHVRTTPSWRRGEEESESWQGCLVTLPQVCQDDMPGYWLDEIREQGAIVMACDGSTGREPLVAAALSHADVEGKVPSTIAADFLALGFCHLLTEVLTVRMRYSSLLDADRFRRLLVEAAELAVAGDEMATRDALGKCFDALAESKDHFYPVDSYLIDLTLAASTTLGSQLNAELSRTTPINLLISARDVLTMKADHMQTFDTLHRAVQDGRVCIVGGEFSDDAPLSLLSFDDIVQSLQHGLDVYQQTLNCRPAVFGRRPFGLSSILPQLLRKCGFVGALHFALDGSQCPDSYHGAMDWEGTDGSQLKGLSRPPLDAQRTESFLALPQHLGDAMDADHVAAICFAHWPGQVSPWYRELQRVERYGSILGRFVTVEDFFEQSELASSKTQFEADDYRTPYLRQVAAAERAAVSPIVDRLKAEISDRSAKAIDTIALVTGCVQQFAPNSSQASAALAAERLVQVLPNGGGPAADGYLAVNPYSSPQTMAIRTPLLESPPTIAGAVKAASERHGVREVLLEVPPMGYAWISGDGRSHWQPPVGKPLAEQNLLRNEHFEVRLNVETGAVQSVHNHRQRGNILSQRLALRLPQPAHVRRPAQYSVMAADAVDIADDGPLSASLISRGRLLDRSGELLARFEQTVRVVRDKPLLYFDVSLDPVMLPEGNPWHSYYAARFAFPAAEVRRSVGLASHPTHRSRLEAPHFVELETGHTSVTLLTGGLPYHVLTDDRQLDSLLIVPGEPARRFQFAVGFDLASPAEQALVLLDPPTVITRRVPDLTPASGWFFCTESRQIVVTHWEPIVADQTVVGVRLRLLETAGQAKRIVFQSFRAIGLARKLDFIGTTTEELQSSGERVIIELGGYECCTLEMEWRQ